MISRNDIWRLVGLAIVLLSAWIPGPVFNLSAFGAVANLPAITAAGLLVLCAPFLTKYLNSRTATNAGETTGGFPPDLDEPPRSGAQRGRGARGRPRGRL
ncbi:MAG: hypothetical protein KDG50_03245 [Chromatiales bacterium]|nr:hypothetical protein [Chromatiales bacterium]